MKRYAIHNLITQKSYAFRLAMLCLLLLSVLVSCARQGDTPQQTRSWYLTADPEDKEFKEIVAMAKGDSFIASGTDCVNLYPHVVVLNAGHFETQADKIVIKDYKSHTWSIPQVAKAAQYYISTWLETADLCHGLLFSVSVTNTGCLDKQAPECTVAFEKAGSEWGDMVNRLNTWIKKTSERIVVWGAMDISLQTDEPQQTIDFVQNYRKKTAPDIPLLHIGTLQKGNKWSDKNVTEVTVGPKLVLLPKVTSDADMQQWEKFAKANNESNLIGVMTECRVEPDIQPTETQEAASTPEPTPTVEPTPAGNDTAGNNEDTYEEEPCIYNGKNAPKPYETLAKIKGLMPEKAKIYALTNIQTYDPKTNYIPDPKEDDEITPDATLSAEEQREKGDTFDKGQDIKVTPIAQDNLYP